MRCGLVGTAVVCGLFFQPIVRGVIGGLMCTAGMPRQPESGPGTLALHQCCVSTPE